MNKKIFEANFDCKKDTDNLDNFDIVRRDNTLDIIIDYPILADEHPIVKYIEINQVSARASDGVRLHYDYDRDGFVVCQPKITHPWIEGRSYGYNEEWIEVGFFKSWQFEEEFEEKDIENDTK